MFRYLNLQNQWRGFERNGMVVEAGKLRLADVPGSPEALGPLLDEVEAWTGPAGIGVDPAGNLYLADPANHRVIRIDACDGQSSSLPCLRGPGSAPGQLDTPRGVVAGPRHALYVADSGNHRIQVVDLRTGQIRAVWGQPEPYGVPTPSDEPGRLTEPWDMAPDRTGHLYVVDHGNARVQKFDAAGRVYPSFWEAMQPDAASEPGYVAVARIDGREWVLVLDVNADADRRVLVFEMDGSFDADATAPWEGVARFDEVPRPAGIAFDGQALYVGDADRGRILVYDREGTFVGWARGYRQSIAYLTVQDAACTTRLLAHPGGGAYVRRLTPSSAYVECGTFLAGPFEGESPPTLWQRLAVEADVPSEGTHVRFFTLTSDELDGSDAAHRPGAPAACTGRCGDAGPASAALTPLEAWRAFPPDASDALVLNEPGRYLWIGGLMQGSGSETPLLHQMRVEYDDETWLRYLPELFQRDSTSRVFLDRALALFESMLDDEEALIESLPRLFYPGGAPNEDAPASWLDWLSGWVALSLDETWSEAQRRKALARAFEQHGRRGTLEGLQHLVELYTGAGARLEEPAGFAHLWSLGERGTLGFETMLAPAHAQGAVVGTTATLDQSHLIAEADYGAPLFEDVAHHFCVQVYAADLPERGEVERVRAVLDREKPAHTTYHLCLITPRMRVGFQARLGIDTIIGGAPADLVLGEARPLGIDTALPNEPDRRDGARAMGQDARVGRRAALT